MSPISIPGKVTLEKDTIPTIVTDSLALNLDAASTSSYPGSGTSWTDLSGQNNTGTLTNGPTFNNGNGGTIVFDGSNDHVLLKTKYINSGNFAIEVWFRQTSYSPSALGNARCLVGGSDNSSGADNCQFLINDNGGTGLVLNNTSVTLAPGTAGLISLNNWYQVIWTRTGSTITYYVNGISRATGTSATSVRVDRVGQVGPSGSFSKNLPGNISSVKFYNKGLTQAEVSQNFNALKGRYGL